MPFLLRKKKMTLSGAVRCHIGHVRQNNEDNFYFSGLFLSPDDLDRGCSREGEFDLTTGPVFAVCDGMGGEDDGETAAYMAVTGIASEAAKLSPDWETALKNISQTICLGSLPGTTRGCTAALVGFSSGRAHVFNVGDSRIYLFRKNSLRQLSRDHSPVYEMYEAGLITRDEVRLHPRNNIISRFLGMEETGSFDPFAHSVSVRYRPGDIFLICSDGLSDLIPDLILQKKLLEGGTVRSAADRLLREALDRGGRDNVTLILLKVTQQ